MGNRGDRPRAPGRAWLAAAAICAAVCAICLASLGTGGPGGTTEAESRAAEAARALQAEREARGAGAPGAAGMPDGAGRQGAGALAGRYESPIDFESLQAENGDIYAWLYIPGTGINYPLLQREGDDGTFYLEHGSSLARDPRGALFTQCGLNGRDFSDPAVVVYGHNMRSGEMFGSLQATYSQKGALEEHGEVLVYLPDRELSYTVFAAVPFEAFSILHYYDFGSPSGYRAFVGLALSIREVGANVDMAKAGRPGEPLLILSTCLRGNNRRRYIVIAKRRAAG